MFSRPIAKKRPELFALFAGWQPAPFGAGCFVLGQFLGCGMGAMEVQGVAKLHLPLTLSLTCASNTGAGVEQGNRQVAQ
ncbi:hypothetical protein B9K04_02430 [Acetobacter syzygii]|nr:hypothetical protein B9K04_02430 [Acetobacter syzygii]